MELKPVPELGKEYMFYDDGKVGISRRHKAKVVKIIPFGKSSEVILNKFDHEYLHDWVPTPLNEIWKEVVELDKDYLGRTYLYANSTDYFIGCEIPSYDKHIIWFSRTTDGGWFSFCVEQSWQEGRLDVDGTYFKED